jgi:hypothetical protein
VGDDRIAMSERERAYKLILDSISDVPRQLQFFVDRIVEMQTVMPMPRAGWEQFVRDIEYTNEKHGLGLTIG